MLLIVPTDAIRSALSASQALERRSHPPRLVEDRLEPEIESREIVPATRWNGKMMQLEKFAGAFSAEE